MINNNYLLEIWYSLLWKTGWMDIGTSHLCFPPVFACQLLNSMRKGVYKWEVSKGTPCNMLNIQSHRPNSRNRLRQYQFNGHCCLAFFELGIGPMYRTLQELPHHVGGSTIQACTCDSNTVYDVGRAKTPQSFWML